jgi:hypothetical protein
MLVYSYAAHDCQIKSNLYKQSENSETDLDTTEPKGDIVIEMSGKYGFKVTLELIEIMEAESIVFVNWS